MVDTTAGHEQLTFLDTSSWYKQIQMYPPDEDSMSGGIDRYLAMPFGLKNVGTTIQHLVNKMFKD